MTKMSLFEGLTTDANSDSCAYAPSTPPVPADKMTSIPWQACT